MLYTVIYLWRGERHRADTTRDRKLALSTLDALRADGWVCWLESEARP